MKHRLVFATVFAATSALVAAGTTTTLESAGANSRPTTTLPSAPLVTAATASKLTSTVAASTAISKLPGTTVPPVSTFLSEKTTFYQSGTYYIGTCDPQENPALAANPEPCLLGDQTSSRTIVLVGDSNVGNWAPGLDFGLRAAHYRLAAFFFAGCPTPDLVYPYSGGTWPDCNTWHQMVIAQITALHPVAVVSASGPWNLGKVTAAQWTAGYAKLFALATGGNKSVGRVMLGTSPVFAQPVPACILRQSNPQKCALDFSKAGNPYTSQTSRNVVEARAAGATLIPTSSWFCKATVCSPVIGNFLPYTDINHVTIAYSEYLSSVLTSAVLKAAHLS